MIFLNWPIEKVGKSVGFKRFAFHKVLKKIIVSLQVKKIMVK